MFKVFLDGTEYTGVSGFDDFEELVERDKDIRGLILSYPIELTFFGDAYDYIVGQLDTGGFCQTIEVLIQERCSETGVYEDDINGLMFLADNSFIRNETECTIRVKVADNNYGAKIKNNKNIQATLSVPFSKNGVAITACPVTQVAMFRPSNGVAVAVRYCYDIVDAFRYLVSFMTDGEVEFISDYLDSLTINSQGSTVQGIALVTGLELRAAGHTDAPDISFRELFDEVNKKFNIGFTIEDNNGTPRMRIEDDAYFYNTGISFIADKIPKLESSFDPELLYSSIKLGSSNTATYDNTDHSLPPIQFLTFLEEQYTVQGTCNIDKELDLVSDFIIDHNIIEELIETNTTNEDYDDEVIMIQYYLSGASPTATQGFYTTSSGAFPALYNEILTNRIVARTWNVQGDVAKYLGNGNDEFYAERTSSSAVVTHLTLLTDTTNPYPFENDSVAPGTDPNNRYNNSTYRYTSPQNGVYGFQFTVNMDVTFLGSSATIEISAERYSAANVLLETFLVFSYPVLFGSNGYAGDAEFFLVTGEYVRIKSAVTGSKIQFRYVGGLFTCVASTTGGGIYEEKDADEYYVRKYEFEYPISKDDFDTIKADLSKGFTIGKDSSNTMTAWIRKLSRKKKGGLATIEMITNNENI